MTLRTALARLLVQMEADGKSPLTVAVYRTELARFVAWAKPGTDARRIRPDTLARYFAGVSPMVTAAGAPRSPRTVNRAKAAIRLLFRYLADTGAIPRDPSRVLKNARTDRPIPTVLSEAEARAFAKALAERAVDARGKRDQVLFTLLLRSGMRLGAALALDVAYLDLRQGTARSRGKHAREQLVYLPPDVVKLLRRHVREAGVTEGAIFRGARGRLSPRQAQYRFRQAVAAAGIKRAVTVHSLRHTFATRLRERTGDLRLVQAALGHRQIATTEVYAAVTGQDLRRAINA